MSYRKRKPHPQQKSLGQFWAGKGHSLNPPPPPPTPEPFWPIPAVFSVLWQAFASGLPRRHLATVGGGSPAGDGLGADGQAGLLSQGSTGRAHPQQARLVGLASHTHRSDRSSWDDVSAHPRGERLLSCSPNIKLIRSGGKICPLSDCSSGSQLLILSVLSAWVCVLSQMPTFPLSHSLFLSFFFLQHLWGFCCVPGGVLGA